MKLRNIRISTIFVLLFSFLFLVGTIEAKAPAEVQNVEASIVSGEDGAVNVSWDAANGFEDIVIGYKLYYGNSSVQEIGVDYEKSVTLENETSDILEGLDLGKTYYIAVTAINTAGEESETYSKEISIEIPAPASTLKVISARQTGPKQIQVEMSGVPQIENMLDAFFLESVGGGTEFEIVGGKIVDNLVILQINGELVKDSRYRVTATSAVKDEKGVPVSSGITDTVEFLADFIPPEPEPEVVPEPEPEIIPEPVPKLSPEPVSEPEPVIEETREPFGPELPPKGVEPESEMKSAAPDIEPPLDVTQLQYDTTRLDSNQVVVLNWKRSLDQAGDVRDQVLYVRENRGLWDNGYSMGKDVESTELKVEKGKNYEVRISTIDNSGNESVGTFTSFSTQLSQSGPSMTIVIAIGIAMFFFMVLVGRRRS